MKSSIGDISEDSRQYDCDPRSPFFAGYTCSVCKLQDLECKCERELEAAREALEEAEQNLKAHATLDVENKIEKLENKIATLKSWNKEYEDDFSLNDSRPVDAVISMYKSEIMRLDDQIWRHDRELFNLNLKYHDAWILVKKLEVE